MNRVVTISHQKSRLDTKEAAKYVGLGYSTMTRYRQYGGGPRFAKIGSRVVYDVTELDSWVGKKVYQTTSQYV